MSFLESTLPQDAPFRKSTIENIDEDTKKILQKISEKTVLSHKPIFRRDFSSKSILVDPTSKKEILDNDTRDIGNSLIKSDTINKEGIVENGIDQ